MKLDDYNQPTQKNLHIKGIILFVIINIIWGTTFPLIEKTVGSLSPSVLIATRFAVAALFFSVNLRRLNALLLRDGLVLGLLFFVYLATETIALESIHANRAAFIVSLSAILVPLLGLLLGRRLPLKTFVAAGLALIGIGVMSWEGGVLGIGELLMFGDAILYAVYTLVLERVAKNHPSLSLTSVQLLVIAVLGALWSSSEIVQQFETIGENWAVILYLGLIATAIVVWLQTLAQQWIRSDEAALLYTLEPIFSAIFSFWLLGEQLGIGGFIGAALVLSAMVLSQSHQDSQLVVQADVREPEFAMLVVSEASTGLSRDACKS
jgi:drug/metabolite transporter (DMT)-like permease